MKKNRGPKKNLISVDFSIFSSGRSPFEALVCYLKDVKNMNYHEIGVLLNRDERNIWTVYTRGKKKK